MTIENRFLVDLHTGKIGSYQSFAAASGVSIPYVRQLASELARKGYIASAAESCGPTKGCDGCPLSGGCALTPYDIWELSEKGRQLVETELARQ